MLYVSTNALDINTTQMREFPWKGENIYWKYWQVYSCPWLAVNFRETDDLYFNVLIHGDELFRMETKLIAVLVEIWGEKVI